MTNRTTAPFLLAALLLLAQAPAAVAAGDPDEDEAEEHVDAKWSLSLATEVDQQDTRGVTGELGRDLTPNTLVRLALTSTDYTPRKQAGFKAQAVEAGASHDFERFSIQGALAHWQDTDIVSASELRLGGDVHFDPWSAGLRTGYRRADFDRFTSAVDVPLANGTTVAAGTTSHCKLDNAVLGVDGRYEGDVWGGYATLMRYQYRDAKCQYTANDVSVAARAGRQQLIDLSGGQLDRLAAVVPHRIGRQETLLESSLDAGASWKHDDLVVSLDYSRQQDYLSGATSNTYAVTGTADLGEHAGVDCTIGVTRGGSVTNGGFVGFAVRAKF
jgi:hypothetical protein